MFDCCAVGYTSLISSFGYHILPQSDKFIVACFSDGVTYHCVDLVSHTFWNCFYGVDAPYILFFIRDLSWWALFFNSALSGKTSLLVFEKTSCSSFGKTSCLSLNRRQHHTLTQFPCTRVLLGSSLSRRKRWAQSFLAFATPTLQLEMRIPISNQLGWRCCLFCSCGAGCLSVVVVPWSVLGAILLGLDASALWFVRTASRKQLTLVMLFNWMLLTFRLF